MNNDGKLIAKWAQDKENDHDFSYFMLILCNVLHAKWNDLFVHSHNEDFQRLIAPIACL